MKQVSILFTFAISALLMSCGVGPRVQQQPIGYDADKEIISKSVFDAKDKTISEEDIQRLLNGKIVLPENVRIAVYKNAANSINRYYTNWSSDEEYLKTQQSFVDTLMKSIGKSPRVRKVIPIPSVMMSANPSITQLREIAVRLQADILIVYTVTSDTYFKYKTFQKNEAKAFATCETVLMDIRTGVIPHTSIVTREMLVVKDQKELTNVETRKKAEKEAVGMALLEAGKGIALFLDDKGK